MLSLKQVEDFCLYGKGSKECRYLEEDDAIPGRFYCLKKIVNKRQLIDKEVAEFIKDHKGRGINPSSIGIPLGDNCSGYVYLKHKLQGYDLKK